MNIQPVIVLITAPSIEVAEKIARNLVEQRLAACVNILPQIRSIYAWEGQVNDEPEILLIAKTQANLFENQFISAVRALHPYQVPEIIAVPVSAGFAAYLQWIGQETSQSSDKRHKNQ